MSKMISRVIETMSRVRETTMRGCRADKGRGHRVDEGRGKAEGVSGRLGTTGCHYSLVTTG